MHAHRSHLWQSFGHLASSSSYCLCSVVQEKCPNLLFPVGPVEAAPSWTRHCVWSRSGTWHLHRRLAYHHTGSVTESHSSRTLDIAVYDRIHSHILRSDCVWSSCFLTMLWTTLSLWYILCYIAVSHASSPRESSHSSLTWKPHWCFLGLLRVS